MTSAIAVSGELAESLAKPTLTSMLAPGLHFDVPESAYHSREIGVASKSVLDLVHQSPAHYQAWLRGEERAPTPAMLLGSLAHAAVLEPHRPLSFAGAGRNKAEAEETVRGIARAVRAHPLAAPMLARGRAEVTVRWDDADTGVPCKGRLDWYDEGRALVVDLKTTVDASASEFARALWNYRYFVQAAMYLEGLRALGAPADHFVLIAVEKSAPFAVATYVLDADALARGARAMRADLRTFAECLSRNVWPSYPEHLVTLSLPAWARDE